MINNIDYIINYEEGQLSERKMRKFEYDLRINKELEQQYIIYRQLNEYMRAKSNLDEVRNDPVLPEIDIAVKETITEYQRHPYNYKDSLKFIKDALDEEFSDKALEQETNQIKREIDESDINEISEGWVKEWKEKNQDFKTNDPNTEKIKNFITQSLESEKKSTELKIIHKGKFDFRRSEIIRFIAVSAAVLIAGAVLFRTLLPPDDPEKLYKTFYIPMNVLSPVTRGINSGLSGQYDKAIEMYSQGNYQLAASMFDDILQKNPSFIPPHFFQGITQLQLGNYVGAISQFSIVTAGSGEYMKEAQWYLGLSYLKIGEKTKAIPYFEILSSSEGYYHDQARKLLRRLK